ncbi:hypothetical protein Tco_0650252 [Tanacetum coccineum]
MVRPERMKELSKELIAGINYDLEDAMYACLSCLVGLRLLVKVRRSIPYIILHPNRLVNSNEDVIEHDHVYKSVIMAMYVVSSNPALYGVVLSGEKIEE